MWNILENILEMYKKDQVSNYLLRLWYYLSLFWVSVISTILLWHGVKLLYSSSILASRIIIKNNLQICKKDDNVTSLSDVYVKHDHWHAMHFNSVIIWINCRLLTHPFILEQSFKSSFVIWHRNQYTAITAHYLDKQSWRRPVGQLTEGINVKCIWQAS